MCRYVWCRVVSLIFFSIEYSVMSIFHIFKFFKQRKRNPCFFFKFINFNHYRYTGYIYSMWYRKSEENASEYQYANEKNQGANKKHIYFFLSLKQHQQDPSPLSVIGIELYIPRMMPSGALTFDLSKTILLHA